MKQKVAQGDEFKIGNLNVQCLATPCHTTGHICFYVTDSDGTSKAVFTGDTLFIGGCGRFFEGDAIQMNEALNVKLASLPDETVGFILLFVIYITLLMRRKFQKKLKLIFEGITSSNHCENLLY